MRTNDWFKDVRFMYMLFLLVGISIGMIVGSIGSAKEYGDWMKENYQIFKEQCYDNLVESDTVLLPYNFTIDDVKYFDDEVER